MRLSPCAIGDIARSNGDRVASSWHPLEIIRRLWEAIERDDMRAVFSVYDPSIVWDGHGGAPADLIGTYSGHEGVREWFRQWLQSFENFQPHAETFIDAGDKVVVGWRGTGSGKASGAEVEMSRWNVYAIREGLVVRVDIFETEAEAREAVGLPVAT